MNQSIDLDNPMFSAYAAGELEGAELEQFEVMLEDSSALKELKDTEDMISLLTDCFQDEVKTNLSMVSEDHSLTDYALGVLDDDEIDTVDALLEESEETSSELAGIQEMMGLLTDSLEGEWRARESVELDVPAFTDYALGELVGSEADEFESILRYSSSAKKELGETEDLISLLSEGLEKEWKSELSAKDHEFSLVEATGEENVIAGNFAQASQGSVRSAKNRGPVLISLAAVLAGLLVVGGMLSRSETGQNSVATGIVGFSSDGHVWSDSEDRSTVVAEAPVESPFNLKLLDEVSQPLELAEIDVIDPLSMEMNAGSMVNVDFMPMQSPVRVDSYLPAGHFFYVEEDSDVMYDGGVTFPEVGFDLESFSKVLSSADLQEELKSIVIDLDGMDREAIRIRLIELIEAHEFE